jgi:class 3 adenylate cyclase/Flp pilus assembly protein TadD/TolB-like protein
MTNPAEISTQKVAAIMFTDISGFSKKLTENEVRAFELLKTHDALIRVLTAKFDGKLLKSLGDSFLVEFPNCVGAVKCAIEIQKRFWNFNRGKSEADTIRIRIGIHLSEVAVRHADIIDEDITIATRIEALTEPNRICITLDVYNKVKSSFSINVFKIGTVEFKDISRQVEVYEVLIDSIPDLAKPSQAALQASSVQEDTFAKRREAEELHEAKRIEEAKQRLISDQSKVEEERKREIALHYTRAETFFEVGQLEKAEQELAEIAKLEAQYRPLIDLQRKDKENERIVQDHLSRAREFFKAGNLNEAETEVNEIFRLLPLHTGAQQLLMQIEEERYHQEERKRAKQTDSVAKQVSDDERKIEELLNQVRTLLQEEKFTEATFVLHDLFLIDPNHSGARRLEESIRQAKQAKAELQRIEEEQVPEKQHLQDLAKLQRKLEEKMNRQVQTQTQSQAPVPKKIIRSRRPPDKKQLHIIGAIIISVIVLWGGMALLDLIFPRNASIAVLRFINAPHNTNDLDLLDALPVLLAEDFSRCEHVIAIAPSSSILRVSDVALLQKTALTLHADYLVLGTIQEDYGQYSITLSLFTPEQEKIISVGSVEGSLSDLNKIRTKILEQVLEKIGIKSEIPEISQPTNTNALEKYLKGLRLMQLKSGTEIDSAKTLLQTAVQIDPSFGAAYATLADLELRMFRTMDAQEFLNSAAENAKKAIKNSPNNALAYRVLGTYYRFIQNYDSALSSITKSVVLLPQDPECYRELAFLSLAARKFDDAAYYASDALRYDPRNTESYFTLGLVQHMRQNYSDAEKSYQQAQPQGESNLILIADYVQNVWISEGNYDRVVRYCQQILLTSPENYRYYYWIGRAYQLSLQIGTAQEWLEKGLTAVRQTIDDDPNDAIAHAYAGLIHSRLGQFSEGEAALNKAIQLDSNSAEIMFRFADIYSIQQKKQKAMAALERALHRQYNFAELLNPDLSSIAADPEFLALITKKIEGKWPAK